MRHKLCVRHAIIATMKFECLAGLSIVTLLPVLQLHRFRYAHTHRCTYRNTKLYRLIRRNGGVASVRNAYDVIRTLDGFVHAHRLFNPMLTTDDDIVKLKPRHTSSISIQNKIRLDLFVSSVWIAIYSRRTRVCHFVSKNPITSCAIDRHKFFGSKREDRSNCDSVLRQTQSEQDQILGCKKFRNY